MSEQGLALGLAIMTALVFAIFAYALLMMAASQARHAKFYRTRAGARDVSEAALVFAREQLMADPNYCPTSPVNLDLNWDGIPDPPPVNIAVTNCGAGNSHLISAQVIY